MKRKITILDLLDIEDLWDCPEEDEINAMFHCIDEQFQRMEKEKQIKEKQKNGAN